MKPQSEELLYYLMWAADTLMRPSWRKLAVDSFEAWAWRNNLGRRLAFLEREKLIERHPEPDMQRVVRLTELGRRQALGGRDPVLRWNRAWDGRWRIVLFDLPSHRIELRKQLWRTLQSGHFGYLQHSVWVSPDPVTDIRSALHGTKVRAESFLVMEGNPVTGESDAEIVTGAWDFPLIHKRYEKHLRALRSAPTRGPQLVEWARRENAAWRAALQIDPLLPASLLPPGYPGREAFQERKRVFAGLARSTEAALR